MAWTTVRVRHPLDHFDEYALVLDVRRDTARGRVVVDARTDLFGERTPNVGQLKRNLAGALSLRLVGPDGVPVDTEVASDGPDGLRADYAPLREDAPVRLEVTLGGHVLGAYTLAPDGTVTPEVAPLRLDTFFLKELANTERPTPADFAALTAPRVGQLRTDLHTHLAGAVDARDLVGIALAHDAVYPDRLLRLAGVEPPAGAGDPVRLRDLRESDLGRFADSLRIGKLDQVTFVDLERIYALRQPLVKNPALLQDILVAIARSYQAAGTRYAELSTSDCIAAAGDFAWMRAAHEALPRIERETGVKLRFLAMLTRHNDPEWNVDELARLDLLKDDPYVVGLDIAGHETNSTLDFKDQIGAWIKARVAAGAPPVVRVHAGENPSSPENVREALQMFKDAGLPRGLGRVGHGLYGVDERTLALARETGAIVEINASSNLSLNNINGVDGLPLHRYLAAGIPVVLGTDGPGIYQNSLPQEVQVAARLGVTEANIAEIAHTERAYLAQADRIFAEKVARRAPLPHAADQPPSAWTPEVDALKRRQSAARLDVVRTTAETAGARFVAATVPDPLTGRPRLDPATVWRHPDFAGKQAFLISGGSVKNWAMLPEDTRTHIRATLEGTLALLDPNRTFLVTGGTDFGVEKVVHEIARRQGFTVLGTLTEEVTYVPPVEGEGFEGWRGRVAAKAANEIKPGTVTHVAALPGNWWAKAAELLKLLEASPPGTPAPQALFVAGGAIVADEIQAALNNGLRPLLMSGVGHASDEKAALHPDLAVPNAAAVVGALARAGTPLRLPAPLSLPDYDPATHMLVPSASGVAVRTRLPDGTPGALDNPHDVALATVGGTRYALAGRVLSRDAWEEERGWGLPSAQAEVAAGRPVGV